MKKTMYVLLLSIFMFGSLSAQTTTTTEDGENKKEDTEKKVEDKDTSKNEDKPKSKWKIDSDIKNPFEPKKMSAAKTALEGVAIFTKRDGVDYLKPVVGYQLQQLNIVKEAVAHIYLAPEDFNPSRDEKQLVEDQKAENYIVYTWCPCKEIKEKCPCTKKKVVKIISKK